MTATPLDASRPRLSDDARRLLASPALAHLATINRDGSPQVSVVWVEADGDDILFGVEDRRVKAANIRRDDRVVLSLQDTAVSAIGLPKNLIIQGRATIEGNDGFVALMDRLSNVYFGHDYDLPNRGSSTGQVVRVRIDRIGGEGYNN